MAAAAVGQLSCSRFLQQPLPLGVPVNHPSENHEHAGLLHIVMRETVRGIIESNVVARAELPKVMEFVTREIASHFAQVVPRSLLRQMAGNSKRTSSRFWTSLAIADFRRSLITLAGESFLNASLHSYVTDTMADDGADMVESCARGFPLVVLNTSQPHHAPLGHSFEGYLRRLTST